jgi:hypothetical protein
LRKDLFDRLWRGPGFRCASSRPRWITLEGLNGSMPPLCSAPGALLIQVRVGETTPGAGYLQARPAGPRPPRADARRAIRHRRHRSRRRNRLRRSALRSFLVTKLQLRNSGPMKLQLHGVRSPVSGVVEILSAEVSRSSLPSWGPPERPEGPARVCGSWSFLTRGNGLSARQGCSAARRRESLHRSRGTVLSPTAVRARSWCSP